MTVPKLKSRAKYIKKLRMALISTLLISSVCLAAQQKQQNDRQWSVMAYYGVTAKQELSQLIKFNYSSAGENLYSAELAYALAKTNPVTRFFNYLFINKIQLAGNMVVRNDYKSPDHKWLPEFDLYIMARRTHFPWDNYLKTSIAVGEGLSYALRRIYVENNGTAGNVSPRLLNFLVFELTFGLPKYPHWELVARIHHRSACYGTFYPDGNNSGSNDIGIGLRYYFAS
jgi:hypothetical protein